MGHDVRGREDELARLDHALGVARWVTLVGPPGVGKSRVARAHLADRADVVRVDLHGVQDPAWAVALVLSALGCDPDPGEPGIDVIARAAAGQLLVLDGLGVELTEVAAQLSRVVAETPDVRVLATSMSTVGVEVERVVRINPFAVPQAGQPLTGVALELFLDRVERSGGQRIDLAADGEVVRGLLLATGGLPVLIDQLAVQSALVGLSNAVATESVDEAVDAAYHLLGADERRLLRRMASLPGPATLDVLGAVAGLARRDAATAVAELARRSLVEVSGDGRFDLLRPIRDRMSALSEPYDAQAVADGLLYWAETTLIDHPSVDSPWLVELPVLRMAVETASADPATRDRAYRLVDAAFAPLFQALRVGEAADLLHGVLRSGHGPPELAARVARRAAVASGERRGRQVAWRLLQSADDLAERTAAPSENAAGSAAVRAWVYLRVGELAAAKAEAERALTEAGGEGTFVRRAAACLAEVNLLAGHLDGAVEAVELALSQPDPDPMAEALTVRLVLARVALERGRALEAAAVARAVAREAATVRALRVQVAAETIMRLAQPGSVTTTVAREALPGSIRVAVQVRAAREALLTGELDQALMLAADAVVMADSVSQAPDVVEARLVLAQVLATADQPGQALSTFLTALEVAADTPMPLRAADALDGLAHLAILAHHSDEAEVCRALARALRRPSGAVAWGLAAEPELAAVPELVVPTAWVSAGQLTSLGVVGVAGMFGTPGSPRDEPVRRGHPASANGASPHAGGPAHQPTPADRPVLGDRPGLGGRAGSGAVPAVAGELALLTRAEQVVAVLVAQGLTNRQIAEQLVLSPRTVESHLANTYRKLGIRTRARLAAIITSGR